MKQRSFTLVELVVTMGVLSIVGLLLVQFIRDSYMVYLRGQISSTIHEESNSMTSRMANALRGTYQVQSATSATLIVLTYFAPTDVTPTKVTIQQTGTVINLTTIQGVISGGTYVFDPATTVTRPITSHFVNNPPVPLFRYYDESNTLLSSTPAVSAVHLIEVTSTVYSQITPTKTASAVTKVELRNLKTNL